MIEARLIGRGGRPPATAAVADLLAVGDQPPSAADVVTERGAVRGAEPR